MQPQSSAEMPSPESLAAEQAAVAAIAAGTPAFEVEVGTQSHPGAQLGYCLGLLTRSPSVVSFHAQG